MGSGTRTAGNGPGLAAPGSSALESCAPSPASTSRRKFILGSSRAHGHVAVADHAHVERPHSRQRRTAFPLQCPTRKEGVFAGSGAIRGRMVRKPTERRGHGCGCAAAAREGQESGVGERAVAAALRDEFGLQSSGHGTAADAQASRSSGLARLLLARRPWSAPLFRLRPPLPQRASRARRTPGNRHLPLEHRRGRRPDEQREAPLLRRRRPYLGPGRTSSDRHGPPPGIARRGGGDAVARRFPAGRLGVRANGRTLRGENAQAPLALERTSDRRNSIEAI
jgi:hypothetical protein